MTPGRRSALEAEGVASVLAWLPLSSQVLIIVASVRAPAFFACLSFIDSWLPLHSLHHPLAYTTNNDQPTPDDLSYPWLSLNAFGCAGEPARSPRAMAQTSGQMHHLQQQQQGSFPQHVAAQSNGGQRDGVQWGGPFPSLHLWPIQETFTMKMIHLPEGQRVSFSRVQRGSRQIKIGRQTNNKTVPGERNAYFDSKVLSRTHAEIWEQNDKVRCQDRCRCSSDHRYTSRTSNHRTGPLSTMSACHQKDWRASLTSSRLRI
jgi:hypothetical protein